MSSESIHFSGNTVRRVMPIVKWLLGLVASGIAVVASLGIHWLLDRTSVVEVSSMIAKVQQQADTAKSAAYHAQSLVTDQADQLEQLTAMMLDVWAQSEVDRAYSKSPRRNEYIESARKFYARTYRTLRDSHTPALALEMTHAAEWRPDR